MQGNVMWNGIFTLIKDTMQNREAIDAVLYLLTRDKQPHLLPIHADDTEETACDLLSKDNIKYVAFVLITNAGGQRNFEFHPIYPKIEWPHEIVQDIFHRAHEVAC